MLTPPQLQRAASDTGFPMDSLEKVWMLVRLLSLIATHPFLGRRVALKGGTALNLFVFELPRLSVDIDVNYIGAADRDTMMNERPKVDAALSQVASRLGLTVKHAPSEHAGGKWRLSYTSALGRPAMIEVDVNYMLRVPLWDATPQDSREFLGDRAKFAARQRRANQYRSAAQLVVGAPPRSSPVTRRGSAARLAGAGLQAGARAGSPRS